MKNKQALLVGCGSKFGLTVLNSLLTEGWTVNSISSSQINSGTGGINQLVIDWNTVGPAHLERYLRELPEQDFVFFNQNSSALEDKKFFSEHYTTSTLWKQEKAWSQAYYVSCILPFHIIQTLGDKCTPATKIGWMLSSLIYYHHQPGLGFADYVGNKYQNFVLMKNFSLHHKSCFYGIDPKALDTTASNASVAELLNFINTSVPEILNGKVISFDLREVQRFNLFDQQEI